MGDSCELLACIARMLKGFGPGSCATLIGREDSVESWICDRFLGKVFDRRFARSRDRTMTCAKWVLFVRSGSGRSTRFVLSV